MSKSNRRKKNELIKIYGPRCFIEVLEIRKPDEINKERKRYNGKKQLKIMDELTYHHIKERSKGGSTTVENGAILRNINHQWFNRQSKERQAEINEMFKEYKRNFPRFSIVTAQMTSKEIKQTEIIDFKDTEKEVLTIPVYDMTKEDLLKYEEYKAKRNQRIINKLRVGEER